MEAFFKELGETVLKRWKQENFSLAKFPAIAVAALESKPPAKKVNLESLMRDFLLNDSQPGQTDSPFGEPELIVYSHPRFYIQLLFWLDGTTAIHQHEFSGAFHVMHGSSIHAQYAFDKARSITPYLRVGDLRMKDIELLETGRTVPIVSGQQDIHSLFHLDTPSVTVVVRTQHDPGTGPQFNYLPPHVAFDPYFSDGLMTRRKQLLDVLAQGDDPAYPELVREMIADLDFERGFSVLYHCMAYLQQIGQWDPAMAIFEKKHGSIADGIAATLKENDRRSVIKNLRSTVLEPEHRFFLALLMNAPTRAHLLALVERRFRKEAAIDVVMRWAQELTEVTESGLTMLDALFPETIACDDGEQLELFLAAFRHFLTRDKKLPPGLRGLKARELKDLRAAFAQSTLGMLTE